MTIRIATEIDLPAIIEIYNQSVAAGFETADLTPLKVEERINWFRNHEPDKYPIYVATENNIILGWISVSPYRSGRMALRFTKEISYYVDRTHQNQGIGSELIEEVIRNVQKLNIKTLLAIVLDQNKRSVRLLQKLGFELWGSLPGVADFDEIECGHVYYGFRIK